MSDNIDPDRLRHEVRGKCRDAALQPGRVFDFHTGRPLAERLGYPRPIVDALPDRAIESFAGIGNPFALRPLQPGENVLDVGCGARFDAFVGGPPGPRRSGSPPRGASGTSASAAQGRWPVSMVCGQACRDRV